MHDKMGNLSETYEQQQQKYQLEMQKWKIKYQEKRI